MAPPAEDISPASDDGSIPDDAVLWRRILDNRHAITKNKDGTLRPSSLVFRDGSEAREVSLHLADLTTVETVLQGRPDVIAITAITAGEARNLGYAVVSDPQPDDPSHVYIRLPDGQTHGQEEKASRRLANGARWIKHPPETYSL